MDRLKKDQGSRPGPATHQDCQRPVWRVWPFGSRGWLSLPEMERSRLGRQGIQYRVDLQSLLKDKQLYLLTQLALQLADPANDTAP